MHADTDHYTGSSFERNGGSLLEKSATRMPATLPTRPPATRRPEPPRRSRLGLLFFGVLILLGAGFVFGLLPRLHQRARVEEDTRQLSIATVTTTSPAPSQKADPLVLSGELRPLV